jgi:predicted enzyme related to lactoylglutathione lyase
MELTGICLITGDVPAMGRFYSKVLGVEADGDDVHLELRTKGAGIAIFSTRGMEEMAPRSTERMGYGGVTIGIRVDDVDAEYERLAGLGGIAFVKAPQTHPWGNRSFWFRDPDGNIVDFWGPADRLG